MAYLATLEGDTITLDDLYNVNDYLGVKYFGVDAWNRIKDFACKLTENAAKAPAIFCISHFNKDYTKPASLACELLGFNDELGVCAMGSTAWNTLKCRLSDELLGLSLSSVAKKVGGAVKKTANVAKSVATAPLTVGEKLWTETPLKYTPGGILVKKTSEVRETVTQPIKDAAQKVVDTSSSVLYNAATKTPLKYTGYGVLTKLMEKTREASGVTSKGTADVYETDEEKADKARRAAEAAAKAAANATAKQAVQIKAANEKKAANAVIAQQQQEQAATQKALEVMENKATSKYYPIIFAGVFGLLALSILRK